MERSFKPLGEWTLAEMKEHCDNSTEEDCQDCILRDICEIVPCSWDFNGKPELKRCPFCGGEATIGDYGDGAYKAYCEKCFIGTGFMSKEEAVDKWNKRLEDIVEEDCDCYTIVNGVPRCYGTKETEVCSCNGKKSKCKFKE